MGLRTNEIATARIENMNLNTGDLYITDSKRKELYPIPLSFEVAKLAEKVVGDREEGLVVQRRWCYHGKTWEDPLSDENLWLLIRRYACAARIPNWEKYNLRLLRHFFAVTFARGHRDRPGSLETLRRILRHKDLTYTQVYLSRLILWEDIKREYDEFQRIPNIEDSQDLDGEAQDRAWYKRSAFYQAHCKNCDHEVVCRFKEEACQSEWVQRCRFESPKNTSYIQT